MATSEEDAYRKQPIHPNDQPPHNSNVERILYLGPDLSFSYAAAHAVFPGRSQSLVQGSDFVDIFSRLQSSIEKTPNRETASEDGHYDFAIVPVVNSTNGPVVPVVDLLRRCGDGTILQQAAERGVKGLDVPASSTPGKASAADTEYLPADLNTSATTPTKPPSTYPNIILKPPYTYDLAVHHYLYVHPTCPLPATDSPSGTPNAQLPTNFFARITSLHTHPQVWTQCSRFLQIYFPTATHPDSHPGGPGPTQHDHPSTSAASLYILQHGSSTNVGDGLGYPAAICSRLAGEARGLKCVAAHIEDDTAGNATTFVVLGVAPRPEAGEAVKSG